MTSSLSCCLVGGSDLFMDGTDTTHAVYKMLKGWAKGKYKKKAKDRRDFC